MSDIFISYRRDDASGYAGRLHDSLEEHFGPGRLFRDIDSLTPGAEYRSVIDERLESCRAVLALIGPRWLTAADSMGRRRLDDPNDVLRLELVQAVNRSVLVIPVLIDGADMPAEADLPLGLRPLAGRNAMELTDSHWDADVALLARTLQSALDERRTSGGPAAQKRPGVSPLLIAVLAFLVVVAGIVSGVLLLRRGDDPTATSPTTSPTTITGAGVPHVYNLPQADGQSRLMTAGYKVDIIEVCSGSVGRDRVRQVVAPEGPNAVLDDAGGVTDQGRQRPGGSTVVVKVSNGVPCLGAGP
ncbi:MAG: TIR domain-containing protein [Acidimicrobiales bacterium]